MACVASLPGRFSLRNPTRRRFPPRRAGEVAERRAQSADLPLDRQSTLAASFRPRDRRHSQRLRPDGIAAQLIRNCSTGWRRGSWRDGRLDQADAPADRHERGVPAGGAVTTPTPRRLDAENRLLWRMNRRRLDAESVHDAILAAAGRLDGRWEGHRSSSSPSAWRARHPRGRLRRLRLESPWLGPTQRLPVSLPHASRPIHGQPRRGGQFTADRRAYRIRHPASGARPPERPLRRMHERTVGWKTGTNLPAPWNRESIWPSLSSSIALPPPPNGRTSLSYVRRHGLPNLCRILLNSNEFLFVN